jgi:hypothetical protein
MILLLFLIPFWNTDTEKLKDGTEPIQDFIEGVPNVKVFKWNV